MILMLKISDYSEYDYAADFEDEVDSDNVVHIVGGSTGIQGQTQPPSSPSL